MSSKSKSMFVPGRIEFLGKHTDYCGGSSIVCAIDRGFHAEIDAREDAIIDLLNLDTRETLAIRINDDQERTAHWAHYVSEVADRLYANFGAMNGCRIRFESDLPRAAGLSSSSALMIMVFAALDHVNNLGQRSEFIANIETELDLSDYLACIENGRSFRGLAGSAGVGTFGGSQDHAAILLGKKDLLTKFSFSPLRKEEDLSFTDQFVFVVAFSGVAAEKTGAAKERYNRLARMVSSITSHIAADKTLAALIEDLGINELLRRIRAMKTEFAAGDLVARTEQFRIENFEIIPEVSRLLAAGQIADIGCAIDTSQSNAERYLGNQIGETAFLQRAAREIGAVAASAFGAGFGGSVYAVVKNGDAKEFAAEWKRVYLQKYPDYGRSAEFFSTRPSTIKIS